MKSIIILISLVSFSFSLSDLDMKQELYKKLSEKYKDFNPNRCKWLSSNAYFGGGSCRISLLEPKKKVEENE